MTPPRPVRRRRTRLPGRARGNAVIKHNPAKCSRTRLGGDEYFPLAKAFLSRVWGKMGGGKINFRGGGGGSGRPVSGILLAPLHSASRVGWAERSDTQHKLSRAPPRSPHSFFGSPKKLREESSRPPCVDFLRKTLAFYCPLGALINSLGT